MSISSALTALNQDIQNARTAIVNKGGTVTSGGGSSQLATDIATISGGSSCKYSLLDRVKDDNNNEIGIVVGFFVDYNNVEYAVVCLEESYISETSLQLCSSTAGITNLPSYNNLVSSNVWEGIETATSNTNTILNYCQSCGYTSAACNHCRQYSFVIDGTIYYGQLPNMQELNDIARHYAYISDIARAFWSSNAYNTTSMYYLRTDCRNTYADKTSKEFVVPVLEIPNGD